MLDIHEKIKRLRIPHHRADTESIFVWPIIYGSRFIFVRLPFWPKPIFICFKYTQHAFLRDWRFALCFATWNYSVGVLKAVKSSAYIYMVPVITIAASVLILHENMTWIALLGGALTLLGLYISEMKPKAKLMENGCKMDA
ncbi:EamA family transporter [Bacillus subtilis]